MLRVMTIAIMLACLCGGAYGQSPITLVLCADEDLSKCEVTNTVPEVVTIHMYLVGEGQTANSVFYYAPTPSCWTGAVFLGDDYADEFLPLGSTHDAVYGLSLAFGQCRDLPVKLGSMTFWSGGSEPCCYYEVLPTQAGHLGSAEIVTCPPYVAVAIDYRSVTINPDKGCTTCAATTVASEETTWGRVKSLYQ